VLSTNPTISLGHVRETQACCSVKGPSVPSLTSTSCIKPLSLTQNAAGLAAGQLRPDRHRADAAGGAPAARRGEAAATTAFARRWHATAAESRRGVDQRGIRIQETMNSQRDVWQRTTALAAARAVHVARRAVLRIRMTGPPAPAYTTYNA